jgi:NAD(P)-dependent dehydrogenase (short-subunit alcohol dehydrogenase family)
MEDSMGLLENKIALITGGNSGIGLGTALTLADEGVYVYATGRDAAKMERAADALGDRGRVLEADVTRREDLAAVVETIREHHGRIDILFANAGASWYNTIEDLTDDQIGRGVDLDLKGTIRTVQMALPLMPDGSAITVNTSVTQDMGLPTFGVYAAAKAGLRSLVRTWTNELRDRRIRVNAVSPGAIETEAYAKDMGVDGARAYVERVVEEIPAGRIGQPEDIGHAVAFLVSDRASFVNGIELTVDGGQTQIYAGHN